jgi:hypothetical protein
MSFHTRLKELRENPDTARAGVKWSEEENSELMERAVEGVNIDEIAKLHKRTVGAVKARIMENALTIVNEGKMTMDEVSNYVHVSMDDLTLYKERNDNKAAKANQKPNQKSTSQETTRSDSSHIDSDDDNQGRPWSTEEETNLIEEIKTLDIEKIADVHKRTECSIRARLRHIGRRMIHDGTTLDDVCDMLKLSPTIMQKSLNMRKTKQIKNEYGSQDKVIDLLTEIRDLLEIISNK